MLIWFAISAAAFAAEPGDDWKLERIWVKGNESTQGLLLSKSEYEWEFAEIVRPRGKRMYAIVRAIPAKDVVLYNALEGDERAKLVERFNQFRNRSHIEAGKMEHLALRKMKRGDEAFLVYDGFWFSMFSTADEATTRRAIVRLEQTFRAYRQILPPRIEQVAKIQAYIYGSNAEYRAALARQDIEADFPAFFSTERNAVIAGSDLDRVARELAATRKQIEVAQIQLKELTSEHEKTLLDVAAEMKRNGFASADIQTEVRRRRSLWGEQNEQLHKQASDFDHKNSQKVEAISRTMFRRLNHEAFHAYVENYVYPHDRFALPRWLNEGLAQVFEHAQLDADTLRIDAPAHDLLTRLQTDLRSNNALSLAELLGGAEQQLADHRSRGTTQRYYLYAWGLAHYLACERSELQKPAFTEYIAVESAQSPAVPRFEKWIGQRLDEFEPQWRKAMLEMK